MANIKLSSNVPWLFYSVVVCCLLFLFSLWFFLHPNSPWHSKYNYSVSFKEIGDLKVGDAVNVGGLKKGKVESMSLTDSCVWVTISVLTEVKIPIDSKLNAVNVGLMGDRAVEISIGSSEKHYEDGASIEGYFDMGSTDVGALAFDILKDAGNVMDMLSDFSDTLFSEDKMDKYKKIGKKGKALGSSISRVAGSAENSLNVLIDSLLIAKDKTKDIIEHIKTDFDKFSNNIDLMKNSLSELGNSLDDLKTGIEKIAKELDSGDNTVSLTLSKNQTSLLKQEMKKISEDAEDLMKKIKDKGLDLNVDFGKSK